MGAESLLDRFMPRCQTTAPSRRQLLGSAAGVLALGCGGAGKTGTDSADTGAPADPAGTCGPDAPTPQGDPSTAAESPFDSNPFGLGVASGDPRHDRVIIWTRLVVEATDVAQSPPAPADVVWELATDSAFDNIVQQGMFTTTPERAHAVHVDVDGLESATTYWYRFRCGDHDSPVGRTRTLPCDDARPESVRIGFAVCQNWMAGFYAAYRHMAEQQLDLVVHLGDYIYEAGETGAVRDHGAPECTTLDDYRNRHGLYRSDADLQAAHGSAPWALIWDDHEVDNNHAGAHLDSPDLAQRRAAAYQAWLEHMPVREALTADPSEGIVVHGVLDFGRLARVLLLDGRQHRDAQPCGGGIGASCDEVDDERSFLGDEQDAFVDDVVGNNPADWVLVANPVVMLPLDLGGAFLNPDQWDGYPRARDRFLAAVAAGAEGRTVLYTGDIHAGGAGVVPSTPDDYTSAPGVAELVVPPISSRFTDPVADTLGPLLSQQEHIAWWDWTVNGWAEAEVREDAVVTTMYSVTDVTDPASAVTVLKRWTVAPGALMPTES